MSGKTNTATAEHGGERVLTPELRFPEFQDAEGWREVTLEDLLAMPATYGIVTAGDFQLQGIPMLRGGDIKDGRVGDDLPLVTSDIHSQYKRTILQTDDVVIALVGYPGEAAVVPAHYVGANISRAVGLLRLKDVRSGHFVTSYLNSPVGRRTVLKPSAGSAQIVVNLKDLNALKIPVPTPTEQKKIADCLSSVDELIAAQDRKVDTLKTHKKGLMQQLFPREGETQPRLRLPEFRDAGDWEESTVEEVISTITPPKRLQTTDYQPAGEFPIIDQSQDYICGWTNDGEAVMAEGAPVIVFGDHTCALKFVDRPFAQGADGIKIFKPKRGINARFLFCALEANPVMPESYKRHFSILKEKTVSFPYPKSDEQQRIADCLTSLDDLIAAQTQKLDTLKTHKKGLMQQLFPSVGEADA